MIPNLRPLDQAPIARTNMVQLAEDPLIVIRRLLSPVSNQFAIDFEIQRFTKERKEKSKAFWLRVHREVKNHLRRVLGLEPSQDVKYELHSLPNGRYIYFYLAPAAAPHSPESGSILARIEKLCQKLSTEDHSLMPMIQGLFGLHLKMVMLEQANERFCLPPVYFNAALYLNARLTRPISKASGTGIMEAFELNVYASEYQELAFTLHKRKFLVEPAEELRLALDDENVWFNTASGRVQAKRKLDARESKLAFFKVGSDYGESQAYTYNVVMNAVIERLTALEIPHSPIPFQASYELNQFATDLDQQLHNTVLVVDNGVSFTDQQRACFFEILKEQLPDYQLFPVESLEQEHNTRFAGLSANSSMLVLNPVADSASNSIRQLDDDKAEYGSLFAVYDAYKKGNLSWDTYTQLKLDRLIGWIDNNPLPVVLQGINIDKKLFDALDLIIEKQRNPDEYRVELARARSRLKSAVGLVKSKIRRTKTELWFKESLLTRHQLPLPTPLSGRYSAYYVRITKGKTTLLGYIELVAKDNHLCITKSGITEGDDLDWLQIEHPPLKRLNKLFNEGFYLYDHANDILLTAYNSGRVPRLIGPFETNVVDLYAYQEQEKALAERNGETFAEFTITRSAKPESNVLPYLISPGRSKHDPLTKTEKMKHHHIYLQSHEQGLYVLVSDAQPANITMERPKLVENLLILDAEGKPLDVLNHPLTGVYLNSFTLDMLRSGESSKTSIFAKLARLMVEN